MMSFWSFFTKLLFVFILIDAFLFPKKDLS